MSFSSNMLNAIARLDNAYGETMKDDTFKEKLGVSLSEKSVVLPENVVPVH